VCAGQAQICNLDPACTSYAECLGGCTTSQCRTNCANTAGPTAVNRYNTLHQCVCNNCSACSC
jgi:hypothetical protein